MKCNRLAALGLLLGVSMCYGFNAIVTTDHVHKTVDEKYLSFTLDADILDTPKWKYFNLKSTKIQTLLKGLSPAFLRFGGTSADYVFYTNSDPEKLDVGLKPKYLTMNSTDWDNLVALTRATNLRFLFEFNLQHRYGEQWDPSDAAEVLAYLASKGYGENLDFELGNEPDWYYDSKFAGFETFSGERIAEDYGIFRKLLDKYSVFKNCSLVGPDTGSATIQSDHGHFKLFKDFLNKGYENINAATSHTYYFSGKTAKVSDYYDSSHFDFLYNYIKTVQDEAIAKCPNPKLQYWIGETADSNGGGTPNVTNRYVSGFLWLDKLGLAATMGVGVVMRQTFYGHYYTMVGGADGQYYPVGHDDMDPNPDYWISYLHKQLVGQRVLMVDTVADTFEFKYVYKMGPTSYKKAFSKDVRIYAHCTQLGQKYGKGAVTVFGLNVKDHTEVMHFEGSLGQQTVDVYLLTPYGPEGLLSRSVALNGKQLVLVNDESLPELVPKSQKASDGITIPSRTFGFFVFPNANATACM